MSTPHGLSPVDVQTTVKETWTNHPLPHVVPEKLQTTLPGLLEELSEKTARSVNEACHGHLINDSQEPVRQAGQDFLRGAFEAALQHKFGAGPSRRGKIIRQCGNPSTRFAQSSHSAQTNCEADQAFRQPNSVCCESFSQSRG